MRLVNHPPAPAVHRLVAVHDLNRWEVGRFEEAGEVGQLRVNLGADHSSGKHAARITENRVGRVLLLLAARTLGDSC